MTYLSKYCLVPLYSRTLLKRAVEKINLLEYSSCMLSSVIIAYYLQQFSQPVRLPHRVDQSPRHIQSVHPRGNLTVAAESSGAATVPPGAQRVEMMRLRMTAGCSGDITINTISVQRRGLGANADIASIYAVHRGKRISRARPVSRKDGSVDLNVRNFKLPACEAEDILVLVNFSPTASAAGEHRFQLRGVEAAGSTVRIEQHIAAPNAARRTSGRAVGQIDVDYLNLTRKVRFGRKQTLSRFTLKADKKDDHLLRAITFTNNGSATKSDLKNLYIGFRNRRISTLVPQLNGDTARIEFDPPFLLRKNQKLKFGLHADVNASRSRTIQFVIEEEGDLEATPAVGR
jgi:hypothetical protein